MLCAWFCKTLMVSAIATAVCFMNCVSYFACSLKLSNLSRYCL